MNERRLIYNFKIKKKTVEIIYHCENGGDSHYWFYVNGCKTDVCFPRSIGNDGTSLDNISLIGLFEINDKICYGASMYNKSMFMNYFASFKNKFPELFI